MVKSMLRKDSRVIKIDEPLLVLNIPESKIHSPLVAPANHEESKEFTAESIVRRAERLPKSSESTIQ